MRANATLLLTLRIIASVTVKMRMMFFARVRFLGSWAAGGAFFSDSERADMASPSFFVFVSVGELEEGGGVIAPSRRRRVRSMKHSNCECAGVAEVATDAGELRAHV